MATKPLRVRILAFAQAREALGTHDHTIDMAAETTVAELCKHLVSERPELERAIRSARIARNGRVAQAADTVADGDEIALLPPVGGG